MSGIVPWQAVPLVANSIGTCHCVAHLPWQAVPPVTYSMQAWFLVCPPRLIATSGPGPRAYIYVVQWELCTKISTIGIRGSEGKNAQENKMLRRLGMNLATVVSSTRLEFGRFTMNKKGCLIKGFKCQPVLTYTCTYLCTFTQLYTTK